MQFLFVSFYFRFIPKKLKSKSNIKRGIDQKRILKTETTNFGIIWFGKFC